MAYTIYFLSHLTIPSSSSHFQSSHVSSIFSGSSAFFHLFSPLIPLLFLFVFSLSHRLCFMPSTRSFSFFLFSFLFHLLYRRSSGSDFFFFLFFKREKIPKCVPVESLISARIYRNQPKRPKHTGIDRNFLRCGTKGYLIPVCKLIQNFPYNGIDYKNLHGIKAIDCFNFSFNVFNNGIHFFKFNNGTFNFNCSFKSDESTSSTVVQYG